MHIIVQNTVLDKHTKFEQNWSAWIFFDQLVAAADRSVDRSKNFNALAHLHPYTNTPAKFREIRLFRSDFFRETRRTKLRRKKVEEIIIRRRNGVKQYVLPQLRLGDITRILNISGM